MAERRHLPERQRCSEAGGSWMPCTGGADGIQRDAYEPMPDAGALLALADEMELDGAGAMDDEDWFKPLLVEYARRIREALGAS